MNQLLKKEKIQRKKRVLEIFSEIKEVKNQIKVDTKKKKVIMPINIIIKMNYKEIIILK